MKLCCTILFLILISCKSTTESPSVIDLLPLHAGNQWIYQTSVYRDSLPPIIMQDTATVSSTSTKDSLMLYEIRKNGASDFYRNRYNGLWTIDSSTQNLILVYEYPSFPGNEYIAEYNTSSSDSSKTVTEVRMNLLSTNEHVITPAGSFYCYHYHYESEIVYFLTDIIFNSVTIKNHQIVKEIYFAPGVGIVKATIPRSVYNGFPNGLRMISELKQYSLH